MTLAQSMPMLAPMMMKSSRLMIRRMTAEGAMVTRMKMKTKAPVASSTRKRLCRLSRVADEESSDDEDDIDFCAGLSLETQPHGILDDDDEDGNKQCGTLGKEDHPRARRCIAEI
mmetsp:Transcript_13840/g.30098  ORF Transcript_13840/g.30098 Transcript_13840/m.30098 type:complete len:115 (-) Transcript_13840:233-577(-)